MGKRDLGSGLSNDSNPGFSQVNRGVCQSNQKILGGPTFCFSFLNLAVLTNQYSRCF